MTDGQGNLFQGQYGREAQLKQQIVKLERVVADRDAMIANRDAKIADLTAENLRLLNDPGKNLAGKFTRESEESRIAALRVQPKTGTKRARVLEVLIQAYPVPLADEQIHRRVGGDIRSINARRKELEEGGWVVKHEAKWHAPSHNDVSTWTLSATAVEILVGVSV